MVMGRWVMDAALFTRVQDGSYADLAHDLGFSMFGAPNGTPKPRRLNRDA